jgi:hypothetical protein
VPDTVDPQAHDEPVEFDESVTLWHVRLNAERFIYGTVSVLAVLAVYEGWGSDQGTTGFLVVTIGSTFALFLAHLYAVATNEHLRQRRRLPLSEWLRLFRVELQYFLVLIPLIVAFFGARLFGATVPTALRVTMFAGIAGLAFLVTYVAWMVGLRRWRLLAAGIGGLVIGAVILSIELLLAH